MLSFPRGSDGKESTSVAITWASKHDKETCHMWNGANRRKQPPPCGWDPCKRMQVGHKNYVLCSQKVYMKVLVCNGWSTRNGMLDSWWDSLESEHWHSFMVSHTIGGKSVMSGPLFPRGCSPPGSTVCGILQARILEWDAMPSSRGSSQPMDWTWVSYIAGGFLPSEPPGKPLPIHRRLLILFMWEIWVFLINSNL